MDGAFLAVRNVLKAWLLLILVCGALGVIGWELGGYRLLSIFLFCALLLAGAVYFYSDRVALAMVGARELPIAQAPLLYSTVERLAARAQIPRPKLYLIPDGMPRALAAWKPSSRTRSRTSRTATSSFRPPWSSSRPGSSR
jgi:heat shock protein HtpX